MTPTRAEILDQVRQLVEVCDWSETLPQSHGVSVRSGIFTSWTWLADYYIKKLGGPHYDIEPLVLDGTRWEYGPEGQLVTESA